MHPNTGNLREMKSGRSKKCLQKNIAAKRGVAAGEQSASRPYPQNGRDCWSPEWELHQAGEISSSPSPLSSVKVGMPQIERVGFC